jgi:hypothetical protein
VSNPDDEQTRVRIRRVPKFSVFLILGGVVGILVTLILTSLFPVDEKVGFGPLFGYFAIYGVTGGVLLGAIVALILDRVLTTRTRVLTASVAKLEPEPEPEVALEPEVGPDDAESPRDT